MTSAWDGGAASGRRHRSYSRELAFLTRFLLGRIKRVTLGPDFRSWKDLLRDQDRPWRTAIGTGLGVLVGATPILGVHTWLAAAAGAMLPVPRFSVLVGKHISNPLTLFRWSGSRSVSASSC